MLDNEVPEPDGSDWLNENDGDDGGGLEDALDNLLEGGEGDSEDNSDDAEDAEEESTDKPAKSDDVDNDDDEDADDDDEEEGDEEEDEEKEESEDNQETPVEEDASNDESDDDVLDLVPDEVINEKKRTYVEREKFIVDKVVEIYTPQVQQLYAYKQNLAAELQAIEAKESEVDEDGFKAQLSLADFRRASAIESELREIAKAESNLLAQAQADEQRFKYENWIRVNLETYPKLAKYEAEVRSLLGKGFTPESVDELYDVAKAKHERTNKAQTPAKKPMSKKQVVEKTLEKQLERKQRAKVSTAKGGGGLVKSAPKNSGKNGGDALDPRLADMLSFTKNYLNRKG